MNDWQIVERQIERSRIEVKRFPWKAIFGKTLTEIILECKMKGWNSQFTKEYIFGNAQLRKYMLDNQVRTEEIIKNIEISVSARFSENNTALRTYREMRK